MRSTGRRPCAARRALLLCLLAAASAFSRPARAELPRLTPYEQETLDEAAKALGVRPEREPEPDGKLVEAIEIVVRDVFDEHDPVPDFVNVFHTMSREHVIRRELLMREGEVYSQKRADESARTLRRLRQLSLVLVVPLRGTSPDRVRLLVIVKDVWSLRMNSDFAVSENGLSYLILNPSEENLAGTHATLGGLFKLDPGSYSFGAIVSHRRISGTDLEGLIGANLIFNRRTGVGEGSYGYFAYGAPLLRTTDRWGWGTGVYFRNEYTRRFRGNSLETYDAPSTPEDDAIPIEYHSERISYATEVVRSFGSELKYDLSFGLEADRRDYRHSPPPGTAASAERDFQDAWMPVSDTRIGPFVQLYQHEERYFRTIELETLGLQEDYRLGLELIVKLGAASQEAGSTRTLVALTTGISYTTALGNGLLRALLTNTAEHATDERDDAALRANLRLASPRFGFGRLILDGTFRDRYENYRNTLYGLGGDGRLRGYPATDFQNSFAGPVAFATNLEFRSASIDILTAQSGFALFYDVGHAADSVEELSPHQSVGLGLRILFPQASRSVLRVDWAFPLNPVPGTSTFPGGFFVTFGQAFSMPELTEGSLANPETYLSTVPQ